MQGWKFFVVAYNWWEFIFKIQKYNKNTKIKCTSPLCIDLEIFCGCLEVARVHSIHALCRARWEFQITRCLWKLHKEGGNPNWTLTEHQFWFEQNCVNVFFFDWVELSKLLNLMLIGRRNENGGLVSLPWSRWYIYVVYGEERYPGAKRLHI